MFVFGEDRWLWNNFSECNNNDGNVSSLSGLESRWLWVGGRGDIEWEWEYNCREKRPIGLLTMSSLFIAFGIHQ